MRLDRVPNESGRVSVVASPGMEPVEVDRLIAKLADLPPERLLGVLARAFGADFPMDEATRILREPTMAEIAEYWPRIAEAVAEEL